MLESKYHQIRDLIFSHFSILVSKLLAYLCRGWIGKSWSFQNL